MTSELYGYSENSTCDPLGNMAPDNTDIQDFIIVPVFFGAEIFLAFLGNGLVVYVMLMFGESNTTNCYIVNLALTDLAFTAIVIPQTMMHYLMRTYYYFPDAICKLQIFTIYVTLLSTCLTLTAMTIDRYFAIVHPISSIQSRTPFRAIVGAAAIWIISLCACVPFARYHGVVDTPSGRLCSSLWSKKADQISTLAVVIVTYVIPLIVIILCYCSIVRHLWRQTSANTQSNPRAPTTCRNTREVATQRRKKVTKMVALIVALFAFCWLPIHVFTVFFKYGKIPKTIFNYNIKIMAHTVSYANSCVNPFVYSFMSDGFRKAIRKAFPRLFTPVTTAAPSHGTISTNTRTTPSPNTQNTRICSPLLQKNNTVEEQDEENNDKICTPPDNLSSNTPANDYVKSVRTTLLPRDNDITHDVIHMNIMNNGTGLHPTTEVTSI